MVRSVPCTGPCWCYMPVVSFLFLSVITSGQGSGDSNLIQEIVRVNVTTLREIDQVTKQVRFNISYGSGQVQLNGFPANRGVSRITCKMDLMDYGASSEQQNLTYEALVSIRLLVLHISKNSTAGVTRIIVQHEVIAIDGNQVIQNETTELVLVVDKEMGVLRSSSSVIRLEETYLHSIPWNKDVSFTFPNAPESGDSIPQQTTREYNIGQNTTLEEEQFPGKLPETPIRAVIPASSYKVMCQFADEVREKLCHIWFVLYPILVNLLQVVIFGVIGAAIVLELLKIVYPLREQKAILQSSDLEDSPKFVPLMFSNTKTMEKSQETGNLL
ncbi:glycoprotein integral membrane protein 1 isoform X2 [Mixophyes fleayi]|uniref:glycoprotein integral membrane protein 1 isoform X2 n=1 Tax=Mixophyes fleayi TaxID=3061075 RepID=UPI003F4DB37B